ncbi:hypothetical protein Tco_0094300, partial [Tanacetum coccineum]
VGVVGGFEDFAVVVVGIVIVVVVRWFMVVVMVMVMVKNVKASMMGEMGK